MTPSTFEQEQQKLAIQIIQNLPEPPKESWFGNPSPSVFFLIGILFSIGCWFFPQFLPFGLLLLVYLVNRSSLILKISIFLALLLLFVPIIEFNKWYCVECAALKESTSVYQVTTYSQFQETAYAIWYRRMVDHSEHQWKIYEKSFRDLIYLELGKIGGEAALPFPALDLQSPNPKLLEILKRMPPQEALQLFVNWQELYETEDFKVAFRNWKAQTDSFLEWLKEKNSDSYEKLVFLLKTSSKPLPSLHFESAIAPK
ncbi:MAG: hypothetical protein AABZ60_25130 [Planctomycetota bacterium]